MRNCGILNPQFKVIKKFSYLNAFNYKYIREEVFLDNGPLYILDSIFLYNDKKIIRFAYQNINPNGRSIKKYNVKKILKMILSVKIIRKSDFQNEKRQNKI